MSNDEAIIREELTKVFWTSFKLLGDLSTFYTTMFHGLSYGTTRKIDELRLIGKEFYEDGTLADFLTNPEKVDDFYDLMKAHMAIIHQKIQNESKYSLDAAVIVFAHGILDASVYGYLNVLSLAIPDSFEIYIDKKQVDMLKVKSIPYEQLLKQKVQEFIEKTVEKESLIYKLDKLHEITKPENTQMNPDHKYDREKFLEFDRVRHDIVHGNNWKVYSVDFVQESFYWSLLNFYLLRLVVQKTGLRLSLDGFKV